MSTTSLKIDRSTRHALTQLATYCWFLYAVGPLTLLLRSELGISRAEAGLHSTAMAIGFIVAGLVTHAVFHRFHVTAVRRLCMFGVAGGFLLFAVGHALSITLAAVALGGFSGALLINGLNPSLLAHHREKGAAALSFVNAAAATVGITAPFILGTIASQSFGWRPVLIALSVICVLVAFRFSGEVEAKSTGESNALDSTTTEEPSEQRSHIDASSRSKQRFTFAVFALVGGLIIEFTSNLFASDVLRTQAGLSIGTATQLSACFILGFSVGRWVAAWLAQRFASGTLMAVAFGLSAAGGLVISLAHSSMMCAAGLLLIGFGAGPAYPLLITLALDNSTLSTHKASSVISTATGLAVAVAPFLLGRLADELSVGALFGVLSGTATASCLVVTYAFVYASRHSKSRGLSESF